MNNLEILLRDIQGLLESVRQNWRDLSNPTLLLTAEDRRQIRRNTQILLGELAGLLVRLDELEQQTQQS